MSGSHDKPTRSGLDPLPQVTPPPYLGAQVSYRFGVPLIYLSGELDLASEPLLRREIDKELTEDVKVLLLDLSELTFMDSRGLTVIISTTRALQNRGWLGLIRPNSHVANLLEITGLTEIPGVRVLPNLEAVPQALADFAASE